MIGLILLISIGGCSSESQRVADVALQAADRQAAQNSEMSQLNREVAAGTKRLVEQDAAARKELAGVQSAIQSEREQLWNSWDALEGERQQIASDRRTKSALSVMFRGTSLVAVALICLAFSWLALRSLSDESTGDAAVYEVLMDGLESDLHTSPQLGHRPKVAPQLTRDSD